jgi:glycyl-tRNA synthetase
MSEKNINPMEKIVSLCKRRGFIFPGSEIYGGLANSWDFGPYGVELKNNIKKSWWKFFVQEREDMTGIDAAILMNPRVWEASGHVAGFSDPLVDCKKCKTRHRGDKLLEEKLGVENVAGIKLENVTAKLTEEKIACPSCGAMDWSEAKKFNLMFKTHQGVTDDSGTEIYLRPETAQGIFVNFKNIVDSTSIKLPFGIAQIGKAFRNEITPGNFIFRTREFEQMEIEYFFDPEKTPWEGLFERLKEDSKKFVLSLGVKEDEIRMRDHDKDELSFYSKGTTDIEYNFPFGWGELCAAGAYRTDYDLTQHQKFSGESMEYFDEETKRKFIPHVIEPSFGADRLLLATLLSAFKEEKSAVDGESEIRTVLKFPKHLAPVKVAILPLSKKDELSSVAKEIWAKLRSSYMTEYHSSGSIGKRYRRQDEIGTPYCVTVDFESLEDGAVTVRDRDTMQQERVKITELEQYLATKLN